MFRSGSITEANVTCWWSVWTPTGALQEAIEDDPWGQRELDPWGWTRSWERPQYSSTECGSEGTFCLWEGRSPPRNPNRHGTRNWWVGRSDEKPKNQRATDIYIYIVLVFIKFPWREHRMDMPLHQSQRFLEIFRLCNFGGKKVASWFTPASGDSLYVGRRSQRWSCIGCRRFGCGHCQWLATALWRSSVSTETLMTSGFNEGWLYNLHSMIHDSVWRCGCLCFCFLPMQITTDEIWWNEGENSLGFLKWIGTVALKDVVIGSGGAMLMRFVQALHFAKRCKAGPAVWLHFLRAIPWYTYTAYTCIWGPIWRMLTDMDPWHFADFSGAYPTKPDFCRDLNLLDFFWSTWPTCWWSELQTTGMSFSWSDTVAMWPSFFMYCRF